jgi:hypothetical protein
MGYEFSFIHIVRNWLLCQGTELAEGNFSHRQETRRTPDLCGLAAVWVLIRRNTMKIKHF